jgi:hypothetical protein
MIEAAGFIDAELVGDTGFDSSAVTRGVLVRAGKGAISAKQTAPPPG